MKYELIETKDFEKTLLEFKEKKVLINKEEKKAGLFKGKIYILKIYKYEDIIEYVKECLNKILSDMGLDVKFESKANEKGIIIKMYSDNNSILIGKNGQTLSSLQNITRQIIKTQTNENLQIILDVENYKDKQNERIEFLAKKLAKEVLETKIEIKMENMNSFQRRLIHNTLSNFKGIETTSEGEEPNRHVIIKPSK